ncbi:STAS domain-containing protein [Limnobacter sp. MED105]|jgi:anti-sigma B factor antagonist|uniref:STAS domain-containing protein n=1 Tax=Limnobacter sp. MED105 TaxID=391597 RepID=UPI000156C1D4|nr:STAS domain-containing protein [Limnobacter sp. MED105]EDM84435.1 anti-anti-sigma factor [Limnobacter sp. MED105]
MVSTEEVGDIFVLRVDAVRLDSAVGTIIRNAVVSKLDATRKFALDISAVKLVDSGGLGSLVALLKNITNHQGKLALVGMNKSVRMMFELSRMDRQFSLLDDMPKAVAFLQQA